MSRPRPRIERALRYIADHLEQPLTTAQIAKAVAMSESHLHRAFHLALGESIGRFVTRKRLETAALRLAYEPEVSITEIALSSGYSSTSNFSKAFASYFGCSPRGLRSAPPPPASAGRILAHYGKDFRPADLYTLPPARSLDERRAEYERWNQAVRFVEHAGQRFCCLASPAGYEYSALEATWSELIVRSRQLGLVAEEVDAWGVAHDSPELMTPERCRYHACVPVRDDAVLPPPLFPGHMPPGRYAVFTYQGPVSLVETAYKAIYSCWFAESSVAPEDFVPLDHYITDEPRDGHVEMELWLRVRPKP